MKQFFAINHHANASKGSQLFANHLINFTYNRLLALGLDPDIALIIAFFDPYVDTWNTGYLGWHAAAHASMGATLAMNNLNDDLVKNKAPEWVGKIWGVYPEGSVKAQSLIPHARHELITGPNDIRKAGMGTLITGIGTDLALATVKTGMTNFLATYSAGITSQAAAVKLMGDLSKSQELLRLTTTEAMLKVESMLITKYFQTPENVDSFFDVAAMRRRNGKKITDDGYQFMLLPDEIKLLEARFTGKEKWLVEDTGTTDGCIFFSKSMEIGSIPEVKYEYTAGNSIIIDLSQVPIDQRFAFAANYSHTTDGEYRITLAK